MAVIIYSGLPGKGKTASATYDAVKKFKRDNGKISRFVIWIKSNLLLKKRLKFKTIKKDLSTDPINKIYSNYPILLKYTTTTRLILNYCLLKLKLKRFIKIYNPIYSNMFSLDNLNMIYQFPKHSLLIVDEVQRYYDSREFKTFPKELGIFLQHHRHATIDNIILVTQHPRRIDNKMRDLAEAYRKYRIFITIPFIPFGFLSYTNYYEFDDYGKFHRMKRELRNYDLDNHFRFFLKSSIFPHYNSKYYHVIFDSLKMIINKSFTSTDLSEEELNKIGHNSIS